MNTPFKIKTHLTSKEKRRANRKERRNAYILRCNKREKNNILENTTHISETICFK